MEDTTTVFEHECTTGFDWDDRDLAALQRLGARVGVDVLRPTVRFGLRRFRRNHIPAWHVDNPNGI